MLRLMNQKDLTQLREIETFMKDRDVNIIYVAEELSKMLGYDIVSTDIKLAINRAYNLNSQESDLNILEALLEVLYVNDYIEKPLHLLSVSDEELKVRNNILTTHSEPNEDETELEELNSEQEEVSESITEDNKVSELVEEDVGLESPVSEELQTDAETEVQSEIEEDVPESIPTEVSEVLSESIFEEVSEDEESQKQLLEPVVEVESEFNTEFGTESISETDLDEDLSENLYMKNTTLDGDSTELLEATVQEPEEEIVYKEMNLIDEETDSLLTITEEDIELEDELESDVVQSDLTSQPSNNTFDENNDDFDYIPSRPFVENTNKVELKEEKNKNSICVSVLVSFLIFGGYVHLKQLNQTNEIEKTIKNQKTEYKNLELKYLLQEDVLKKQKEQIAELRDSNTNLRTHTNLHQPQPVATVPIMSIPPKEIEMPSPSDTKKIKENINTELEKLSIKMDNYKKEKNELALKEQAQQQEKERLELVGLEKDEMVVLKDKSLDLYKKIKSYKDEKIDYQIDETLKNRFLMNCFDNYQYRKTNYKSYCMCISDSVIKNKIDFFDLNTLLLKHKALTKYPYFSYIGFDKLKDNNFAEQEIDNVSGQCYNNFIKKSSLSDFQLNY